MPEPFHGGEIEADTVYLDHAASTPPFPEVVELMVTTLSSVHANPTGAHRAARQANEIVERARERVAKAVGASPNDVVFTSGGTESDNAAVLGAALAGGTRRDVVVSAVEHHAVAAPAERIRATGGGRSVAPVDSTGLVDPAGVAALCGEKTAVVSVMLVNNETGSIEPVADVAAAVREVAPAALIHTDAAQAFTTQEVNISNLGVDLISLSGHKMGGPQGVGALILREGLHLTPLLTGGGQELGRRAGTHNVAAIAGFGLAVEMAARDRDAFSIESGRLTRLTLDLLVEEAPPVEMNGVDTSRAPHILNVMFEGIRAEDAVVLLDREGVCLSAGASCSSGATEASHVLLAMGRTATEARSALRISVGRTTTESEIREAARVIGGVVRAIRGET